MLEANKIYLPTLTILSGNFGGWGQYPASRAQGPCRTSKDPETKCRGVGPIHSTKAFICQLSGWTKAQPYVKDPRSEAQGSRGLLPP